MRLKRCARLRLWFIALAAVFLPSWAHADDSPEERHERLQSLTEEENNDLVRKKRRFDSLSPDQQERLRQLHEQISTDAQAEQLRQTLVLYNEWLKTLTTDQRAELEGLSGEERIAKIREFKQHQEERNFRILNESELPPEDVREIMLWANNYIMRVQDEILAWMPPDYQRFARNADPQRRRRMIMNALAQRPPDKEVPLPNEDEIRSLMNRLSPDASRILKQETNLKKKIVLWFEQLGMARWMPPIGDEELRRFFQDQLSDEERKRLDHLPIEEQKNELRRMYVNSKLRQRGGRDGWSGLPANNDPRRPPLGKPEALRPIDRQPPLKDERFRPANRN